MNLPQLIERIRNLPVARLLEVERFVTALECGGPTPLWMGDVAQASAKSNIQSGVEPPHSKFQSGVEPPHSKLDWPHAPLHRLGTGGAYLVTAGTLYKQHFFGDAARLDCLQAELLQLAKQYAWRLEAWAVFSNHYHFVGHVEKTADNLKDFLGHLHAVTAKIVNRLDNKPGRKVWHNFWETRLTYERSYLARLNYVHQNAVKHGLVSIANQYRWCSAAWLERTATRAQVKTIYSFKTDKLRVLDDFEVARI